MDGTQKRKICIMGKFTFLVQENNQYPKQKIYYRSWQNKLWHTSIPARWLVIFSVGTRGQCVCWAVWLSFLSLLLCSASPRISIRLLGESVSRMLAREQTHEESERNDKRSREKGSECFRYKSSNIGEMQVLNESSFLPHLVPDLVLLPLYWQVLAV